MYCLREGTRFVELWVSCVHICGQQCSKHRDIAGLHSVATRMCQFDVAALGQVV